MKEKSFKCKVCGEQVLENEAILEVIERPKSKAKYRYHKKCYDEYQEEKRQKEIENQKWDRLFEYVRKEILNVKDVPKYMISRLQGFKITNKGKEINRVYTYDELYYTFVASKLNIKMALRSVEFTNDKHRIDYIMAIISNNINDVVERMERKARAKEMIEDIVEINQTNTGQYIKKEENKVGKVLNDLF